MTSVTEHIPGENQSLETYGEVLKLRVEGFIAFMKAEYPEITQLNEGDWDDQYESWFYMIGQAL